MKFTIEIEAPEDDTASIMIATILRNVCEDVAKFGVTPGYMLELKDGKGRVVGEATAIADDQFGFD